MSHRKAIRAWKDEEYRMGLSDADRSRLQENPVGTVELTDADLSAAVGGIGIIRPSNGGFCTGRPCTSAARTPCCF